MRSIVAALGIVATLVGGPLAGAAAPQERGAKLAKDDPLLKAGAWFQRVTKPKAEVGQADADEAEVLIADLRMIQVALPERRRAVFLTLLDFASLAPPRGTGELSPFDARDPRRRVADSAGTALLRALDLSRDGELQTWLASEVLAQPKAHSLARRCAALDALAGRHESATLLGVMSCALEPEPRVRQAALRALSGWYDDGVHAFLLQQLARARSEPGWASTALIEQHFRSVKLRAGGPAARALFEFVRTDLTSEDWRATARALRLLPAVEDELAAPALIEALGLWLGRAQLGKGSRRIEGELVAQLRARSGRNIGPYPERWSLWWRARTSGTLAAPDGDAEQQTTRSSFFGLRPLTDRVTFIVDRSGSMESPGPGGRTRYAEALAQMTQFLRELGPRTRFRVILFESSVQVWKDSLQPADRDKLAEAEQWVGYQRPGGGTVLRPAIERALRIKSDGSVDFRRLEEDTVIVLCDGATADGAAWVEPFLERYAATTCVVFHCVQLGDDGDGTLEALARGTGGEFVKVP